MQIAIELAPYRDLRFPRNCKSQKPALDIVIWGGAHAAPQIAIEIYVLARAKYRKLVHSIASGGAVPQAGVQCRKKGWRFFKMRSGLSGSMFLFGCFTFQGIGVVLKVQRKILMKSSVGLSTIANTLGQHSCTLFLCCCCCCCLLLPL